MVKNINILTFFFIFYLIDGMNAVGSSDDKTDIDKGKGVDITQEHSTAVQVEYLEYHFLEYDSCIEKMVEYNLMTIEMVSNTSTKNNGEPKEIKTDTTIFNWEGNASLLIEKAEKNFIPTTDAALLFIYIHKFYADQHEFFKSATSDPNSFCVAFGFESTRECLMDPSNYKTIAEEDV